MAFENFQKKHPFLIAIDSDGCVFDTMEIKHKECFIPNIIKYWGLQPVSKYARAAAEFVNLYSKWRGVNRFPALIQVFDLLREWPEVQRRGVLIPEAQSLRDWIARETKLGNPALRAEVELTHDPVLTKALEWSEAVNQDIAEMVQGIPPFPYVRESLEKLHSKADLLVCSATPGEALQREWEEHDIAKYANLIAGQELGTKKEHIAMVMNGRYQPECVLMVGDAPVDQKAAQANGARFYPIIPGKEEESWELFYKKILDAFFNGNYSQEREKELIREFELHLPETPPWKR